MSFEILLSGTALGFPALVVAMAGNFGIPPQLH